MLCYSTPGKEQQCSGDSDDTTKEATLAYPADTGMEERPKELEGKCAHCGLKL